MNWDRAYVRRECNAVEAALQVAQDDEERQAFLQKWFSSKLAQHLAVDPFVRGAFARDAGLSPQELGAWNLFHARQKIVGAAVAMYDGSGGGIGDLKRAAKEFIKKERRYRVYKMMAGNHITDWPSLFETADDAARWVAEKDLAADLGLHEYLVVKDEALEKIVKYL